MKKIIYSIILGLSLNAQANLNADSSWSDIRRSSAVVVDAPSVKFGNTSVAVFGVCLDGDTLVGGTTESCVKEEWRQDGFVCVETETVALTKSIVESKEVCSHYINNRDGVECAGYTSVEKMAKTDFDVGVYSHHQDVLGRLLFTKNFSIPACN